MHCVVYIYPAFLSFVCTRPGKWVDLLLDWKFHDCAIACIPVKTNESVGIGRLCGCIFFMT
jgi:hypothetical protein